MPQFEVSFTEGGTVFVRAHDAGDAVREAINQANRETGLAINAAFEVGDPEPGTGWMDASMDGEVWGRVRPRDRMRFRRD